MSLVKVWPVDAHSTAKQAVVCELLWRRPAKRREPLERNMKLATVHEQHDELLIAASNADGKRSVRHPGGHSKPLSAQCR